MKFTELQEDKIYHCKYSSSEYVLIYKGQTSPYICLTSNTYSGSGSFAIVSGDAFTLATSEQEAQLLASLKVKRFVPLKDLKITYEIY